MWKRPSAAPVESGGERSTTSRPMAAARIGSRTCCVQAGASSCSVKDHLTIIFARLAAHSRAGAVARAGALGLIPLG